MPKITVRPPKAAAVIIVVLIDGMIAAAASSGIFEEAGPVGVIWIAMCVAIMVFTLVISFGKNTVNIEIEDMPGLPTARESAEQRLKTLESLKKQGLVTDAEYRSQRERILGSL
jgi:hypothetical protein